MTLTEDHTALVTGASSGIGEATVRALRNRGVRVIAAARRLDRLTTLAEETDCVAFELDVRDRNAVAQIEFTHDVDILINNAGLGRGMGSLATADISDIEQTIDTNVTSAIHMVRAVHVSINQLEIVPAEQTYGGYQFTPFAD